LDKLRGSEISKGEIKERGWERRELTETIGWLAKRRGATPALIEMRADLSGWCFVSKRDLTKQIVESLIKTIEIE
jgi:hypothetical protein